MPPTSLFSGDADAPRDAALIGRLEHSFQLFVRPDVDFAGRFYERLFAAHPNLRPMFPADLSAQKLKFVQMLAMVVENLRTPEVARERLVQLGHSHVDYGARPEHYELVCDEIAATMAEAAGPQWTAQLDADWREVLRQVSEVMIDAGGAP